MLKTGKLSWDEGLFRLRNQVPVAAAAVLTPLSRLFLPAGIIVVVAHAVVYVVARTWSVLPVAGRGRGGRPGLGAGARGQGHCRRPGPMR